MAWLQWCITDSLMATAVDACIHGLKSINSVTLNMLHMGLGSVPISKFSYQRPPLAVLRMQQSSCVTEQVIRGRAIGQFRVGSQL